MNPDRWRLVEALYQEARRRPIADRDAYLADTCAGDQDLLQEVVSLLGQPESSPVFFDGTAHPIAAQLLDSTEMSLLGSRLGAYQITGRLGAGGMGEVYRAHDTRLNRDVAVKILPQVFAADPERLARFEREAHALAALNHPCIAAIYGVEESGAIRALVLELVEGPTLTDLLRGGPMPFDQALPIARQIADALGAAHEKGIVHRDLKPANVKLTAGGLVKVLDFGLAKILDEPQTDRSNSPTLTAVVAAGPSLLGTAAYMSPEQAKGQPVDRGADVWAFGCVLYEMLTGAQTFKGTDLSETLASVLRDEPDWTAWPADVPGAIRVLVQRCLAKDRRQRVETVSVVHYVLREQVLVESGGRASGADKVPPRPLWRRALPWTSAVIVGAACTTVTVWLAMRPPDARVSLTTITASGAAAPTISISDEDVAITPDGQRIVYVGNNGTQLFVRALDTLEPVAIATGTPHLPFVSLDGQWVGFVDNNNTIKKVAITGGPPITIATLDSFPNAATWAPDGAVLLSTGTASGLMRIPARGGSPEVLTRPDREHGEAFHTWPQVLPGGRAVLFTIIASTGGASTAQIAVRDLQSGSQRILLRGGGHAYVAGGYLVYAVSGTLLAIPFDPNRLETRGTPVPVVPRLLETRGVRPRDFALAANGTLVYVDPGSAAQPSRTLVWVDRNGKEDPIAAPPRAYVYPRISPDGTWIAVSVADQNRDIWLWNVQHATLVPLTFDPAPDSNPIWTPDGKRIIFASNRAGGITNIWWQSADGAGVAERLTTSSNAQLPTGTTPDGRRVLLNEGVPSMGRDLMELELDGRGIVPLLETRFEDRGGTVSPNGRWLAYEWDGSGRFEVYVRPIPQLTDGPWQVSAAGGSRPVWARNGEELYFFGLDGSLMSVSFGQTTGSPPGRATALVGMATKLLDRRYFTGGISPTYDVAPDGRRFLMIKASTTDVNPAPQIVVVQHFTEYVRTLVADR